MDVRGLLAKAKADLESGPPPKLGQRWATDLSFDQNRRAIGRSFAGTSNVKGEPFIEWTLNHWAAYRELDQQLQINAITFVVSFDVKEALARKALAMSIILDTGEAASTAIIREYDSRYETKWWNRLAEKRRHFFGLLRYMLGEGIPPVFMKQEYKTDLDHAMAKAKQYFANVDTWRKTYGPRKRHWLVNFVGTSPDCNGQGFGSVLMTRVADLADSYQAACFLETATDKNRLFYEKFGFVVSGVEIARDPLNPSAETIPFYLMTREPRKATRN